MVDRRAAAAGPFFVLGSVDSDVVSYDYVRSPDYADFLAGGRLPEGVTTVYRGRGARARRALASGHLFGSPELVSARMAILLADFADDVQLVDARVEMGSEVCEGFRSLKVLAVNDCVDLDASEYKVTNFDPREPEYMFYRFRVRDDIEWARDLQRAAEMRQRVVVSRRFKEACFAARLSGLTFRRVVDLTPADQGSCEVVP